MACEEQLQALTDASETLINADLAQAAAQANLNIATANKMSALMDYQAKLNAYNACVQGGGGQQQEQTRPKNKGNVG